MKNRWGNIEELIVVLNDDSSKNANEFLQNLELLGKKTKVLILSGKKQESTKDSSKIILLTNKDFSLFGRPKSEIARTIFNASFDLLLVVDSFEGKLEKRMQKVKAKLNVGLNLKEADPFFDINMCTTSNSIEHLINFTKEIVEKIK